MGHFFFFLLLLFLELLEGLERFLARMGSAHHAGMR